MQRSNHTMRNRFVVFSLVLYAIWTASTYLLEGRLNLLQRYDPTGRLIYVLIANVIIGTLCAAYVLRYAIVSKATTTAQLGMRSLGHTVLAVLIVAAIGCGLFLLSKPPSLAPVVLLNAFTQVLAVSIAEVMVCWLAIGSSFEALAARNGRILALIVGIVAADLLFGIYHFAHSAPFNQPGMVVFLLLPGLGTSLVYFLGRNLYAAVVFQNMMGMLGVMKGIDLAAFSHPLYPIYALAFISVAVLIVADVLWIRRAVPHKR